jgi:uncharacterized protein (TIRG00374 family)
VDAPEKPKHSWVWVLVLVALGALGIYVGAPDTGAPRTAWARLGEYPGATLAIVIVGALGLVATEALRIAVIARFAGARISVRDAWDAAVANHVMTAVTPQVGLGEPTVAYTLNRRGVPWDAAVAVPFVKFTTSLALVFILGAGLVAAGFGPPVEAWMTRTAIVWFGGIALVTSGIILVCSSERLATRVVRAIERWATRRRWLARWQPRIARGADVAAQTVARLVVMRSRRGLLVAALVAVHLVYYLSYVAPLVGLALVLGDPPLVPLVLRSLVFLCFVFASPTPGGVGTSEAAAGLFFADLVAPTDAIIVVVVFRGATYYLQLAIGALYLPVRSLARSRR